jgi:hypothetical protein
VIGLQVAMVFEVAKGVDYYLPVAYWIASQ